MTKAHRSPSRPVHPPPIPSPLATPSRDATPSAHRPAPPHPSTFQGAAITAKQRLRSAQQALHLSSRELDDVRVAFARQVRLGINSDGLEIAALPAYLPPLPQGLHGEALAADWGGTHQRAARVQLANGETRVSELRRLEFRKLLPTLNGRRAFELQAALLKEVAATRALPLGYVFSFAAKTLFDANSAVLDAQIQRWSKEIHFPDVMGLGAGTLLVEAARDLGIDIDAFTVLNDTVAALLGGSSNQTHPERTIGLVAGTGFNLSAFFTPEQAPKLRSLPWSGPMAINLEAGAFHPPHLTPFDEAVDARLSVENRGQQRFEKAVAGAYLGHLYNAVDPGRINAEAGAQALPAKHSLSVAIFRRSADLVAATLAGLVDVLGDGPPIRVQAEGGLFWRTAGYAERVQAQLDAMLGPGKAHIAPAIEHLNLVGAAAAALARKMRAAPPDAMPTSAKPS